MSNLTVNLNNFNTDKTPSEMAKETKKKMIKLAHKLDSAPAKAEAVKKINDALKGLTRREAMDLLSKIRIDIIGNMHHESTLDETI